MTAETRVEDAQPQWSLRLPVLLYVVWICSMAAIPLSAFIVSRLLRGESLEAPFPSPESDPITFALIALGSTLLAWLLVFNLLRFAFRPLEWPAILRAVGMRPPAPPWANAAAVPLGSAGLFVALGLVYLLGAPETPNAFDNMMKVPATAAALVVFAIFIAPPAEEIFFRGLFFAPLMRTLGNVWAVVLTTALFALPHVGSYRDQPTLIAGVAVMGLLAGGLRAWTGSIVPGILAHMTFNGTSLVLTMFE